MDNKADFISLAGLRPDGRRGREIRRVRCRFGVFKVGLFYKYMTQFDPQKQLRHRAKCKRVPLHEKSRLQKTVTAHNCLLLRVRIRLYSKVNPVACATGQHNRPQ